MGTTVWIDDETRSALRRLQETLGTGSVNDTIRRLLARPVPGARQIFAEHRAAIRQAMRRHGVVRLVAFGSRARGDADEASDLDLAAQFTPGAPPLAPLSLEADLTAIIGIEVNVVETPNERIAAALTRDGVPFAA